MAMANDVVRRSGAAVGASSIFMHSGEKSWPKRKHTTFACSPKTASHVNLPQLGALWCHELVENRVL